MLSDQEWRSVTAVGPLGSTLPEHFVLAQDYPKPFNAGTRIEFALLQPADVSLEVFNGLRRLEVTLAQGQFRLKQA